LHCPVHSLPGVAVLVGFMPGVGSCCCACCAPACALARLPSSPPPSPWCPSAPGSLPACTSPLALTEPLGRSCAPAPATSHVPCAVAALARGPPPKAGAPAFAGSAAEGSQGSARPCANTPTSLLQHECPGMHAPASLNACVVWRVGEGAGGKLSRGLRGILSLANKLRAWHGGHCLSNLLPVQYLQYVARFVGMKAVLYPEVLSGKL